MQFDKLESLIDVNTQKIVEAPFEETPAVETPLVKANDGWRIVSGKKVWKSDWTRFDTKKNFKPSGFRYNSVSSDTGNKNKNKSSSKKNISKLKNKKNIQVSRSNDKNPSDIDNIEEIIENILKKKNFIQGYVEGSSIREDSQKRLSSFQRNDPMRAKVIRKNSNFNNDVDKRDNFMETMPNSVHNQIANYNKNYKIFTWWNFS